MSQSDYIRYKRVAVELKDQAKNLAPVIDSSQYTNYKAFTLENTIINTNMDYRKLTPPNSVNVFDMQINNPGNCSTFTLCTGTNSRVNRRLLSATQSYTPPLPPVVQLYKKTPNVFKCTHCLQLYKKRPDVLKCINCFK